MNDDVAMMLVIGASGLLFLGLLGLGVLVVRDTVRRSGKWGVNPRPIECPRCGEPAPLVRQPANRRQMLWGGATCMECGQEFDKWGKPVEDDDG
ncbi:MAG TPA: hypothetical protein VD866_18120 [Urbifossiella sp.]|nr:hypothetical protein [Urbifossiella sp.]